MAGWTNSMNTTREHILVHLETTGPRVEVHVVLWFQDGGLLESWLEFSSFNISIECESII